MSSVVWRKKKKNLATVIVELFSLKEKAPTKKELIVTLSKTGGDKNHNPEFYELMFFMKLQV